VQSEHPSTAAHEALLKAYRPPSWMAAAPATPTSRRSSRVVAPDVGSGFYWTATSSSSSSSSSSSTTSCTRCCRGRGRRREEQLTTAECDALASFRSVGEFSSQDAAHEAQLIELWGAFFPASALDARVSEQWKELGFQGRDPASDFRGSGALGLSALHHFASTWEATWRRALFPAESGSSGSGSNALCALLERGYPWACTALNTAFTLQCHLQLTAAPPMYSPDCGAAIAQRDPRDALALRAFLALAQSYSAESSEGAPAVCCDGLHSAFHDVFTISLAMLDVLWCAQWKRCATEEERGIVLLTYLKPALASVWAAARELLLLRPSDAAELRVAAVAALASPPFAARPPGAGGRRQ